ncbi:choice-of-anchor Q domain-containing protein [Arenicella xantha]
MKSAASRVYSLTEAAPAINAGNSSTYESTDQRGHDRLEICAIGAFE